MEQWGEKRDLQDTAIAGISPAVGINILATSTFGRSAEEEQLVSLVVVDVVVEHELHQRKHVEAVERISLGVKRG